MIFVTVSTGHFDPLIEKCNSLSNKYKFFGQIGSSNVEPVFPYIRTTTSEKIIEYMKKSELVISHAGCGMLSTLYELKKPSVIVPKQKKYGEKNDGQVELAIKWCELGMGILCLDLEYLEQAINKCKNSDFTFPSFKSLSFHIRPLLV